jgi:hypothetical protein
VTQICHSGQPSHGGDRSIFEVMISPLPKSTKLYDKRDDINFPIVDFPFMSSTIPAAHAYGVYISIVVNQVMVVTVAFSK